MATDKSEPKTARILKLGFAFIVVLGGIRLAMVSYFDNVETGIRAEQMRESQKPELSSVNAAAAGLTQGPMPIDKAMSLVENASPNRQGLTDVAPQTSHDMRAVTDCWQAMGCDGGGLILPAADAAAPAAQSSDASVGDAGVATQSDAAVAPRPRNNPPPAPH